MSNMCFYMHIYTQIFIYIYIYLCCGFAREKAPLQAFAVGHVHATDVHAEVNNYIYTHKDTHVYKYIYICIYI